MTELGYDIELIGDVYRYILFGLPLNDMYTDWCDYMKISFDPDDFADYCRSIRHLYDRICVDDDFVSNIFRESLSAPAASILRRTNDVIKLVELISRP